MDTHRDNFDDFRVIDRLCLNCHGTSTKDPFLDNAELKAQWRKKGTKA